MKTIILAVDFSDLTKPSCMLAIHLAQQTGATLHLLHVAAPDPAFVGFEAGPDVERDSRAEHLRAEHRQLEALKKEVEAEGVPAHIHLIEGPTAQTILEQAEKLGAQLIVLGSHGRGALYHTLLGSVSHDVLRSAICPVMFYPAAGLPAD